MPVQPTRSIIITGGNSGIGYECAKNIARSDQPWHIVIASRDKVRNNEAVKRLYVETGYPHIAAITLDLASLASVRNFAEVFSALSLPPLQAIVCNAGLQSSGNLTYTQDGFETTFGVNHLGHFLLVNLLLKQLIAPARIVFVSSGTHNPATLEGRFNKPDYQNAKLLAWPEKASGKILSGIRRYSTSKLCNLYCSYELDRRLQAANISAASHPVTVNAYDPGAVPATGLSRNYNFALRMAWRGAFALNLIGVKVTTTAEAGKNLARLVIDPQLERVSGKYFQGARELPSSKDSYDPKKAPELWDSSVEMVQLKSEESILPLKFSVSATK